MKFSLKDSEFLGSLKDKDNKKVLILIVFITILLILAKNLSENHKEINYVVDAKGNLVGISRNSLNSNNLVPVSYELKSKGTTTENEIMLDLKKEKNSKLINSNISEDKKSLEIDEVINNIESSEEKIIFLPKSLPDGSIIIWKKPKSRMDLTPVLLLPLGYLLYYKNKTGKVKQALETRKNSVIYEMPAFNDQLIMLLSCGLIFDDVFISIAEGYQKNNLSTEDYFKSEIVRIGSSYKASNENILLQLNKLSQSLKIKEFARLVSIINDNHYKGVNLCEKLEIQSDMLWDRRKKAAEEKGKSAETKLTFPLALLLTVLIIITAAPAILEI